MSIPVEGFSLTERLALMPFLWALAFPFAAFLSVPIGFLKGLRRKTFQEG
jgi:hypothetical protein